MPPYTNPERVVEATREAKEGCAVPVTLNYIQTYLKHVRRQPRTLSETLLGIVFERAAPELLTSLTPEYLEALARSALLFLSKPGEISVRVYNPDLQRDGWVAPYTVLELSLGDRPFIVDSVRAELSRRGFEVKHLLHPVVGVVRDEAGRITTLGGEGEKLAFELYFLGRTEDAPRLAALEAGVREVLQDVMLATRDFGAMRARAEGLAAQLESLATTEAHTERASEYREDAAFLRWLAADHFVFLGYREYDILEYEGVLSLGTAPDSGLGILSKKASAYETPVPLADIPEGLRERVLGGRVLTVTKTNAEASVHRPVRMDYIGLKKLQDGTFVGENRFVGLFTSAALSTPVQEIPILRHKLELVLELDGAEPGSHDYKEIVSIFNSVPRDELFWSDARRLQRDIRTVVTMARSGGVRLTLRPDPLARGLAVMVIMPRERFNTGVRRRVQRYLQRELSASHTDYQLAMGEDDAQVRFHFFFVTDQDYRTLDVAALEAGVADLTRTWDDHLGDALIHTYGSGRGVRLSERYLSAFDERYRADTTPETALRDIENLEALERAPLVVHLLNPQQRAHASHQGLGDEASHLEIYHPGRTLVLSDVLPLLENLGFRVLEQVAYTFELGAQGEEDAEVRGIDIFRVQDQRGAALNVEQDGERVRQALLALLSGEAENDRLNRLVLYAGLSVRQVALLRALQMYYAQLRPSVSRAFVRDTLLRQPELAAQLALLFEAKFAPEVATREAKVQRAEAAIDTALQGVASLVEDETLRGLANLIEATVRTNYSLGKPVISLKLESARIAQMPEPRPLFEIAVSAPHVEGTHLRGGRVARGGLRWSDRPDDFRTEVLGLMKTQMTKNAVIVPVGSKGGFVLKGAPTDREALQAFVREQYQTYLRGLLDLTDNIVAGETVHPEGLVIYDEPDPYLVVAADKGTATFSDLANATAAEYDFWLGDAFASGGSYGYDHKAEGITARGAWESVKRHFLELGINAIKTPITVFGIGDMSGDVFGNGLLYSRTLKLQAAFNHLHIFLDPDPDPEASFNERARLFELPRSSWEDYDAALISEGGGVYSRFAKHIPLSPQIRALLGIDGAALSGQDLIRAILRMPADLFWNGGVGTYVKASSETHADVGDSSNNAVRIDASELRARVVGEGGNLGLTQLARIEYAASGGRSNTDAIDNSAGVDMSDHEVNLKILMQPLLEGGDLIFETRNALLKGMTDEVSALVLKDNARQALVLSLAQRRAALDPALFVSLQAYLADRGGLRPAVEYLPNDKTALGRGYTRPELAVLLAYTKMGLYRRLLETDFPDEPHFQHYLYEYFPEVLQRRYPEAIAAHPLKREIIATQFTNITVDLLGISFVHRTLRDTGSSPVEVVRAALLALEILDGPVLFSRILQSGVNTEAQYDELDTFAGAVEEVVAWLLLGGIGPTTVPDFVETYKEPLAELRPELGSLLYGHERAYFENYGERVREAGFAGELVHDLASLGYLPSALGVIDVARATGKPLREAGDRFYALGERLGLGRVREELLDMRAESKWEKIALSSLVMALRKVQVALTVRYLRSGELDLETFLARTPQLVRRYDATLDEVWQTGALGLASGGVLRGILQAMLETP